ncbi:phage portal protein [Lachnospiraceae bacterium NSJ-143]|nr:phage portal protein [Lachnospiraceae bacterium NSJ-143]
MDLGIFLRKNRENTSNTFYAASKGFVADGEPVKWEIRPLSGSEEEKIRDMCIKRSAKKNGGYTEELDYSRYLGKIAAASTVYPDLFDEELQNSYGVWGEDLLLKEMLTSGEYIAYIKKVKEVNGFDITDRELVDEAKN